jgi:hypothetical protein
VAGGQRPAGKPDPVVAHDERHAIVLALEAEVDLRRVRVPGDVRQRLLRDPVDDELLLLGERQAECLDSPVDAQARLVADRRGQRGERALQPEVLERLRAQPACDPPHLLRAVAGGLAQLVELVPEVIGHRGRKPLDLQHHARQRPADLIMKLPGDPPPLTLLDQQGAAGAVTPLRLEPVQHLVERPRQRRDVRIAVDLRPRPWRQRIVPAHRVGQLVDRPHDRPQQQQVDREQHQQPDDEDDQLRGMRRNRDRHRREHQGEKREDQHRGVRAEHPPQQRKPRQASRHGS